MTGAMGTASGADHGWLAKVLAGDRLACGVLALARDLPDAEWDAFVRCQRRTAEGTSAVEAALRQGCGRAPA